jgi:uncharacterized membrane protein
VLVGVCADICILRKHDGFFFRIFSAAVVLSVALVAFTGAVQAQPVAQTLHRHVRPEVTNGKAELVGVLPADQQLNFSIVLPLRNQAALNSLLSRLYDPASEDYRQFLSVAQFTDEFGPTAADYQAVVTYAQANGFTVTGRPVNRLVVPLSGTADQVSKAFHLSMNLYRHPTEDRTFFSPDREPTLDLGVPVRHVTGLNNYSIPHPMAVRSQAHTQVQAAIGSGPSGAYLGSDMRAAYYGGTTLTGSGQAVGLLEFGGYDIDDVNLSFSSAGQTYTVPVNNVLLDGVSGGIENDYDAEQVLDIVQAIGMAPGLSQVRVYIGADEDDANILNSMASENIAKELSCSWGWLPEDPGTDDVFFQEFAAQGQSFFVASGDYGALDAAIDPYFYPSEDAYVTSVGGTHLTTNGPGGSWASESAWNSPPNGSGGGVSPDQIPIASWQTAAINTANSGSTIFRNEPDVAMEGDFDNFTCSLGYCYGDYAGTSFAAPRWAAFMALVNQQAVEAGNAPAGGIGFLNPAIYGIGEGTHYSQDFHDITMGNNDTGNQPVWYDAVTGYDLVTGWGSATGQNLINDLAGKQVPGFWIAASTPSVALTLGGTANTTIDITDAANFSGSVTLAITSTLPSGVTAVWGTNPATGSSVLTLKASASAAASTTTVTITGTSGKLMATTKISVVVNVPTYAISSSPGSVQVSPGASTSASITVMPEYGFTGTVTLSASGLPAGVTAVFSPNPTAGASTLKLTASSTAPGGAYSITITGKSGSQSVSTTLPVTVAAPTFSLPNPGNLNIGQGTSGSLTIWVNPEYGFTGSVKFSVSGLPSGVTASFAPNPTTQYVVLTLTAAGNGTVGTSTPTITGTSGSITRSVSLSLGVFAPSFTLETQGEVTVGQGTTAQTYINVYPQYGFTGSVNLTMAGLPSGVTASLTPNPVTQSATLTILASSKAAVGNSTLTITGTSGKLSSTVTVPLLVKTPTFTVSAQSAMSLGRGTSSTAYLFVNSLYGFTGSANLAVSGLPSGVTASFSPNPTNGTSQLTLTAGNTAAVGTSTLTITGTSGTQSASATMALSVVAPSFTLIAPGPVTVGQGSSSQAYVEISSQNGFAGSVTFAVSGLPSGVTPSFSSNPSTGASTLTFTAGSTAAAGTSTVKLTGTSGSLSATTSLALTVATPGFSLYSPGSVTLGQGSSTTASVYVSELNGFSKNVSLAIQGLPSGVTASFSPNPVFDSSIITLTATSKVAIGNYPLKVTGISGSLTETASFTLTTVAPSFTIASYSSPISLALGGAQTAYFYITPQNGFNSNVTLTASGLPSGVTATFLPNPSMTNPVMTLTASSTATLGSSTVTVTGTSGSQRASTTIPLSVATPTFTLSNSGDVYISPGSAQTSYIYVSPAYGFTGSVSLSVSGLPSGVTASITPNPTSSNGIATLALTAASTAVLGNSTLTIKGVSGSVTSNTQFVLHDVASTFSISAWSSIEVGRGNSATMNLYADSQNGTQLGNVTYTIAGLPSGVTASFSPNPASNGNSVLTLRASSAATLGQYNIKLAGTIGSFTTTSLVQLTVAAPTFIVSSYNSVTIGQGMSQTSSVGLQAVDGFTGNVSLSLSGLPSGVTASFASNPVSLAGQGTYVTLNLTASSTAALGQYTVTVTGTSGGQTASSVLTLGVYAPSFSFSYGGISASLGQGSTATSYIYINQQNGFAGGVNLSVAGLPSGVTASFAPNPATTMSTLTLSATSTASLGQYMATVTGRSGNQTVTTPLTITVGAPSFTLSSYSSLDLGRGSSATGNISLNPQYGFNGNVTFSVSGLPAGVTASISPNPSSGSSYPSVTLSATNSATLGEYPLTITGKSGSLTASTTMVVTIHPSSFLINAGNVTLGQGTSTNSSIWVFQQYGFTGSVTFSVSGLPIGVTASFSPNPTTSMTTLTLTASSTASLGEYPVSIIGTSGSQSVSTTVVVGVYQPTFTLTSYQGVTLYQATSSQTYVYLSSQYGFAGNINLGVTGLPSGVTASFSPNPVTVTSNAVLMTLTAASNAPLGGYNLVVTGKSGTQSVTTAIPLTVQPAPPVNYPVTLTPSSLTFPSTLIGGRSSAQLVTLYNPGDAPLMVKSFAFSGANAGEFTLSSRTCVTSLPAYQSCQLWIVFNPTALGAATATLSAIDNGTNSPQSVALSAAGIQPAATPVINPTAGTYSSVQSVTLQDTTSGAIIYYTTNGATPTTSSTKYTVPITVSTSETIKAIAVASGYANSTAVSAAYVIQPAAATPTLQSRQAHTAEPNP